MGHCDEFERLNFRTGFEKQNRREHKHPSETLHDIIHDTLCILNKTLKHVNLLYTALGNVTRHKLRSVVVILCLVAILLPFISAVAVLEGVKAQASLSAGEGADIYVTMDMYGRNGVIPADMAEEIRKIEGVTRSVPRVISRIYIGGKLAVLFGLPVEEIKQMSFLEGSLPEEGEIVIGKGMADALNLGIGKSLEIGVRIFR